MELLKNILFNRFRIIFALVVSTSISLFLLMMRIKLSESPFLLFLAWNLFLATVPFFISFYLTSKAAVNKYTLLIWFGVWLLFLPNAPYIVTDLIHLTHRNANMLLLDAVLISSCAITGLLFYVISVRDMEGLLQLHFSKRRSRLIIWCIPFLAGFGIYLGRFLRWNSWDLLQRPHILLRDIWEIVYLPVENLGAWIVTLVFGISLSITYFLFKRIHFFNTDV